MRWHRGLSPDFWAEAIDTVASGAGFPSLVNDEAILAAACARGQRLEDARAYTFVGCGQTYPHGRGHGKGAGAWRPSSSCAAPMTNPVPAQA